MRALRDEVDNERRRRRRQERLTELAEASLVNLREQVARAAGDEDPVYVAAHSVVDQWRGVASNWDGALSGLELALGRKAPLPPEHATAVPVPPIQPMACTQEVLTALRKLAETSRAVARPDGEWPERRARWRAWHAAIKDVDRADAEALRRKTGAAERAAFHADVPPIGDTPEEIAEAEQWIREVAWPIPVMNRLEEQEGGALTGAKARRRAEYHRNAAAAWTARAAELDQVRGRGPLARGPNLFKSLPKEEFDKLPRPSIEDLQRALDAGRPRDPFSGGPTEVPQTVDRQGDPNDHHARGFDGCRPPASPRRCALDGRLESDTKAPEGGWAWTTVGGKDVCSERCRVREQARQAEWAPDSAAHITKPMGGDP